MRLKAIMTDLLFTACGGHTATLIKIIVHATCQAPNGWMRASTFEGGFMMEAHVSPLESLKLETIHELIGSPGPSVTFVLPPYRPGEQSKPMAALIKSNLHEAARQLTERNIPEAVINDLAAPLEQLAADPDLSGGSHWGRVIFRSPDTFRQFALTESVKPALHVGGCFEIRLVLPELHLPAEFYVLKLSKKDVEVFRCAGLRAEPLKLPSGVPATLEEALAFKEPDHDLENRSSSGRSTGSMHGVRFGTGSGRETQSTYLADFYKAVDRGVRELLGAAGDAPLVLAGVDEDTVIYRTINRYPNLLARSIYGSRGPALLDEILPQAYAIVRSDCIERAARALLDSKERVAPARFSTGLSTILRAAVEGRVARLYIDQAARMLGVFEGTRRGGRWNWGEEDLLNVAAVETILQGGLAFELPTGRIPDGAPVAAILRF
jgi:hypothetical protein